MPVLIPGMYGVAARPDRASISESGASALRVYVCACVRACVCVCVCAIVCACVRMCMRAFASVTCVCPCVCMCVGACVECHSVHVTLP
jgi:hypothetical protein